MGSVLKSLRRSIARRSRLQREVGRHLEIPSLPRSRRVPGSVWAVTMVKDEADIIGHSIRHVLAQGVDGVIVADNLSSDDTPAVLAELAAEDPRVHVGRDGLIAYHQGRKMSHLANLARRAGADWVVLFDADEFWFAEDVTVAEYLRSLPSAVSVVEGALTDAFPMSDAGIALDDSEARVRLASAPNSEKVAIRPRRWVWVDTGNHTVLDLGRAQDHGLRIVHLQYRSFAQLERKVVQGAAALRAGATIPPEYGDHWRSAADQSSDERWMAWESMTSGDDGSVVPTPTRWSTWNVRV